MTARDSAASRKALLDAARTLFYERGFHHTTTRDIGELAGLDPKLIARYFGNKTSLYLTVVQADFLSDEQVSAYDLLEPGRLSEQLQRIADRGPGPVLDAAVRQTEDPAVRDAAHRALRERLVEPIRKHMGSAGSADAKLRAELIAACFVGVTLGRASGGFPALAKASSDEIAGLLYEQFLATAQDE